MSNQVTNDLNVCGVEQQSETGDELAEFNKTLSMSYEVLPLFERQYNAFVRTRQYSMRTNEKLRSRWHDRLLGKSDRGMRTLPNVVSDYHFHNCCTKLMASQSPANFPTFRRHLVPGPGVDKYGQKPIPADMMLRKSERKRNSPAGKNKAKTRATEPVP
ncbi:uncharacterized protein LOC133519139 [Cydia pomonella]|uniref:uncharacterized protein LOC133519139 n=1 Tax=Cydia pomonella TaxID=82600 RepID=UPI002ADD5A7E|nr:uncharacterized protein LOC133519139 [Cydia pomonella]